MNGFEYTFEFGHDPTPTDILNTMDEYFYVMLYSRFLNICLVNSLSLKEETLNELKCR